MLLLGAILVTLSVNQPCDLRIRPELGAQLFGAQACRTHKVRPPMIVRESLVFFPLIHRRSTHQDYIFTPGRRRGAQTERGHRQTADEKQTLHHFVEDDYLCRPRSSASGRVWGLRPLAS